MERSRSSTTSISETPRTVRLLRKEAGSCPRGHMAKARPWESTPRNRADKDRGPKEIPENKSARTCTLCLTTCEGFSFSAGLVSRHAPDQAQDLMPRLRTFLVGQFRPYCSLRSCFSRRNLLPNQADQEGNTHADSTPSPCHHKVDTGSELVSSKLGCALTQGWSHHLARV